MPQIPSEVADHPDRLRWNERYASAGYVASFRPHPLAVQALGMALPAGPVLEMASGPSGSALLAAEEGRQVTAVDISDVALALLADEARRRGLERLLTVRLADLTRWRPPPGRGYALVLATGYWDRDVFAVASGLVAAGGLLGWEGLTEEAHRQRPTVPADWCLRPGEPASLLPAAFEVMSQQDVGPQPATKRQLLARRTG